MEVALLGMDGNQIESGFQIGAHKVKMWDFLTGPQLEIRARVQEQFET